MMDNNGGNRREAGHGLTEIQNMNVRAECLNQGKERRKGEEGRQRKIKEQVEGECLQ